LPQGDAEETKLRENAVQTATKMATEVPLEVAERTVAVLERLVQLEPIASASMRSDLQVGQMMAKAGAQGALANVEINLDGIADAGYVAAIRHKVAGLRERLNQAPQATSA
jgi:formiminotetrahydrofolate cyclodeaminase